MEITELVLVFLSFLIIILFHWSRNNINSPIRNWPVIGMLPGMLQNKWRLHDFFHELLMHSGFTFVFKGPWFSSMDFVLTADPMNVHHIFSKNFANNTKGPEYKMIMEPFGDGNFNSDDDMWRMQQKIIRSMIKQSKFDSALKKTIYQKVEKGLFPILDHVSKQGSVVDMQDLYQRFTFDNMCLMVLGFDPKCLSIELPEIQYEKAFNDIAETTLHRYLVPESLWKFQKWIQIGDEKKLSRSLQVFDKFLYECISSRREKLSANLEDDDQVFDLLTSFLVEEEEDNGINAPGKSDKFLRDMTFNLLAAGRDTISSNLVWFLWLVATHPLVEKKILDELKANLQYKRGGDRWKFSNAREVSKLVYLHGAMCESLRLYPSQPFEHRQSAQSEILPSGHRVDANAMIVLSIYSMGRNEEIWGKDCLEFKPERWISEEGRNIRVPSYEFFTFLAGPRTYIGKDMAFIQVKTVTASILLNYHVHVEDDHHVTPLPSLMLRMKHGLKVRVAKRYA